LTPQPKSEPQPKPLTVEVDVANEGVIVLESSPDEAAANPTKLDEE
jgi:hypothetical protein